MRITAHHSLFSFLILCTFSLVLLTGNSMVCTAQEQDDTNPYIIFAKPGQLYELELEQLDNNTCYTIVFSFNHDSEISDRLMVEEPFSSQYDSFGSTYRVKTGSISLCHIKYAGLETILLGEEHAKLKVSSPDYYVRLVGVHANVSTMGFEVPKSFGIILALCSLLPFFLLIPDALSDLQAHLELDASSKGVYGRILAVLLPILTIGLTFWLLEGLALFEG